MLWGNGTRKCFPVFSCLHKYGSGVTGVCKQAVTNTDSYLLDGNCVFMKSPTGEGLSKNEKVNWQTIQTV